MAEQSKIEAIKSLKERTGAGMMDCKRALEENDYDIEKAIDVLREKGIVKAAKRANRTAAEGLAVIKTCDACGKAAIIEVNCETDFVSATDKFHAFGEGAAEFVLKNEPATIEEAQAGVKDLQDATALATGEKLVFRRYKVIKKAEGQCFGTYIHMGGKIGVVVILEKEDAELANQMAMHIAANNPLYLALEDVPAAEREREQKIAETEVANDEKLANKPEQVKAQIAQRKVDKVLSQSCLTFQKWLLDESKTVSQLLGEKGNKVISFTRYQVGDGVEAAAE
ncbi:MAG: translation elongation factor Ts [Candidatus Enteromonas sp.]|nr:translation elongation factor Ts [Candidatus Enteromonas sp.]